MKIEKTALAKELEARDVSETDKLNFSLFRHFSYDAGYDVKACIEHPLIVGPGKKAIVGTGLIFEIEPGWEIQVRPRSGLAAKFGVTVLNAPGTIDHGYRQEVGVILHNTDLQQAFRVMPGDRIAQLCFRQVPEVEIEYVESVEKTARGGFGSSGIGNNSDSSSDAKPIS